MKTSIFLIFLTINLLQVNSLAKKVRPRLPSFIKPCHRNDPELNDCIHKTVNSLKNRIAYGIPEIFIPPTEPLVIPEIKLNQDSGAIYLHSTYKNIHIHGLSKFDLKNIEMDMDKVRLSMSLSFPKLNLEADYVMKGKIMMMPLVGEGNCKANFSNVELSTVISGQKVKKIDRTFIKVKKIKVDYKLGKVKLNFDNLFNGDSALGDRMNRFLNDNWLSLSEEIQPLMKNAITEIIRSSTDQLFGTYSLDELLPE